MRNIKTIAMIVLVVALWGIVGFRRQISGLVAQGRFSGVTIVQKVYYNCAPGQIGCDFGATQVTALNSNFEQMTMLSIKNDPLQPDRVIDTPSEQRHILPAVNQYYVLHRRQPSMGPRTLDPGCSKFISPGLTYRAKKNILGYEALTYSSADGWISDFFPDLGCASALESTPIKAQPGHPAATTIYTTESIVPFADGTLFVPGPGMVDTLPSEAIHNKTVAGMTARGISALEAENRWSMKAKADTMTPLLDMNWKKFHQQ